MKRLYYWYDINFVEHKIIAASQNEARRQLLLQGDIAIKFKAGHYVFSSSFKRIELFILTKQLATMLKAGLPLLEILHLLAHEHPKQHWQCLLTEIAGQLAKGERLSTVLTQHQSVFPPLYAEIIATGELTGQLDLSFEQLAFQIEASINLQKRLKKALRYPLFLLFMSVVVTLIMLLIVLPKFVDIYQSFDAELPFFTLLIIDLSYYIQNNYGKWVGMIGLFWLIYHYHLKKSYAPKMDKLILKLPFLNSLIHTLHLTQIFQTLSITQIAGIPILSGLNAVATIMQNYHYRHVIYQIIAGIEQGYSFSAVIEQQSLLPPLCSQLILVGEESGTLDLMLKQLAEYYQEQHQTLTDNMIQLFEPLLMLILGLIIGGLIIAMYLPIFQLGDVIH